MKIAILGDTHFGARNASPAFSKYMGYFYQDIFFPYLRANGIKSVFQLGDLFDVRKHINLQSLADCKAQFFTPAIEGDIEIQTLLGNHDIYYRESLKINSTQQVLGEFDNIWCHDSPLTVDCDGTTIDIIPWICKENYDEVSEFMRQSKSDLCLGHFEIDGFAMYRGMAAHGGLSPAVFAKYERVLSGHFHTRSENGNITYVGTPYELTWQDAGDPRGFHVFDTETRQLTFVENPHTIHVRYEYDEDKPITLDPADCFEKFVRIVVTNKKDVKKFDAFMTTIQTANAYEVKIIEDLSEFKEGTIDETVDLEDTVSLMASYVDSVETTADKEKIKAYMKSLYIEAINIET